MSILRRLGPSLWLVAALIGPAPAEEFVLPTETCRGLWIVPVDFGEKPGQTLRMVLDTGASTSSVDPDALERMSGRRVRPGKRVNLTGGSAGKLRLNRFPAKVHELDHLTAAIGAPIDGILGFDVFATLLLTLDYPAGEIRVGTGSLPEVDQATIFHDHGETRPFLGVPVGDEVLAVLVDSGSNGALTLREDDPLIWRSEPVPVGASARYRGIRLDRAGRLDLDLPYGPLVLERPIVDVIDKDTRLAGTEILRRFAWTFDQQRERIRMVPDSKAPIVSDPVRGIGVGLLPGDRGFEVVYLVPDGSAAAAGVRRKDLIVSVDGVPVLERGCTATVDPERDRVRLGIERGRKRIELEVAVVVLVP